MSIRAIKFLYPVQQLNKGAEPFQLSDRDNRLAKMHG